MKQKMWPGVMLPSIFSKRECKRSICAEESFFKRESCRRVLCRLVNQVKSGSSTDLVIRLLQSSEEVSGNRLWSR
jgi:hypothetical protein